MAQLSANQLFIVAILGFLAVAVVLGRLLLTSTKMPYQRRSALVTDSERKFFDTLQRAAEDHWAVFAMVRLADIIRVAPKTPKYQSWQNKIQAKHIDFVICAWGSLDILLAIELDDPSHERPDRIRRDRFVEGALDAADVPLLRVKTAKSYRVSELRRSIHRRIQRRRKVA